LRDANASARKYDWPLRRLSGGPTSMHVARCAAFVGGESAIVEMRCMTRQRKVSDPSRHASRITHHASRHFG